MSAKNIAELVKNIQKHINATIEFVAQDVQKEIQKELDRYYSEYNPKIYTPRTHQLQNCCVVSQPQISNGSIKIDVYLDIESLHYSTPGADPYKTVVAADVGLHGGWDVYNQEVAPWDEIDPASHDLTGSVYGGTSIWTDPIEEMKQAGKIRQWFMKHAKERGLPLK